MTVAVPRTRRPGTSERTFFPPLCNAWQPLVLRYPRSSLSYLGAQEPRDEDLLVLVSGRRVGRRYRHGWRYLRCSCVATA